MYDIYWLVVSNILYFPFHIWENHPHWHSYFSAGLVYHQPDIILILPTGPVCCPSPE
jgi:hypothetical protein